MLLIASILSVVVYHTVMWDFHVAAGNDGWRSTTVDDRDIGGTSVTEDLSDFLTMKFSYRTFDSDSKSYALFLLMPPKAARPIDLSWFDHVTLKARLKEGSSQKFLLMLRDRVDHLFAPEDYSTRKSNEAYFELTTQPQTITIDRESFVVPRWWIEANAVIPSDSVTSFSKFEWLEIAVGDPQVASEGTVIIDEICFSGPLVPPVRFYQGLFVAWLLFASLLCLRCFKKFKKKRALRLFRLSQVARMQSGPTSESPQTLLLGDTCEIEKYDPLTNLLSNVGLRRSLDEALLAVRKGDYPVSIILFDVDDMTLFNATAGRSGGDELLQSIAAIAKQEVSQQCILGRLRDDQFLIVCQNSDRDDAKTLACRLKNSIEQETKGTCSFGIHQLNPINTFEESIERAAKCVREAKFNGKNKVVLFSLRSPQAGSSESRFKSPPFPSVGLESPTADKTLTK